jgi:hypothetical protein
MDEEYALQLGLDIATGPQHCASLQFADGSTALTPGMVYGVRWRYSDGVNSEQHLMNLHVLKNAPTAIILSKDFLLEQGRNAFADYGCYLVGNESEGDPAGCFIIDRDTSHINHAPDTEENRKLFELIHRENEGDWVATLHMSDQNSTQAAVEASRTQGKFDQTVDWRKCCERCSIGLPECAQESKAYVEALTIPALAEED